MNALLAGLLLLAADPSAGNVQAIDFDTEIVPVLTRYGCNAGACHGAAAGRGGLHLSLFGSDPAADYDTLVHAFEGRRIHLQSPGRSLVLRKPMGELDHGGGDVLGKQGTAAALIHRWIEQGARRIPARRLSRFEVARSSNSPPAVNTPVKLVATAWFEGEPAVDVTPWTAFAANDPSAIELDAQRASATIKRPGQHVVVARYLDRVVPVQLVVPFAPAAIDVSKEPSENLVDEEVARVLAELRIPFSSPADDAIWLRRVTLDLTGRLPSPHESTEFLADTAPDKRDVLVDRLLASESFTAYWTLRFARSLQLHSLPNEPAALAAYSGWLRERIARGTPLNLWARQLLLATGDSHHVGPANFGRMVPDARAQAELVGKFFLGVRLGCANCHAHPLDRWTQDDFHGLAAIFGTLERGRNVRFLSRGEVTNPRTGEPARPKLPSGRFADSLPAAAPPDVAADWLTSSENPLFAKVMVNRLWQAMFGRGLVEPVDDLRDTNPATHPVLLERLASDFVANGYDIRHTLRLLARSRAYERSSISIPGNSSDDRFYSHSLRRPLGAEVLCDAIADVIGVPTRFPGHPLGDRAVALADPVGPSLALDLLGRCATGTGCDEGGLKALGIAGSLHLINGELLNSKLVDQSSHLNYLLLQGASDEQIIDEFHRRAFGRPPTPHQRDRWHERLSTTDHQERRERLEDFLWSLVVSRDFVENH